ncbi:MAG: DUF58 domain-containing protein [Desulfobacteraceae bacterium]|nr:DUF58 domain-containing protein [Desulfobacteraceae bacterium]
MSFLAAQNPEITGFAWAVAIIFFLLAGLDAVNGRRRFEGIRVAVPEIIRLTVDRPGQFPVTISKTSARTGPLRFGIVLPPALVSEKPDLTVELKRENQTYIAVWSCKALCRGRFALTFCHVEIPSAWGAWAVRKKFALESEIRAYPNLVSGQQYLGGLFRRSHWGVRVQRRIGKGREFEQLRDYIPSDSYEDIDWKATARRRFPVTRVYQVEQAQEVYVILDASRLSTRSADYLVEQRRTSRGNQAGSQTSIFERYVIASLIMAMAADQAADQFGLLIFSDKPDCFIKAGRGQAHYNACRDALYNRMPKTVSPDFDELFAFVGTRLRKRALLVFLTNMDDPVITENFLHAMPVVAQKHILMVNMLRPPGAHPLFSSDQIRDESAIYRHLAGHMLWNTMADTRHKLKQHGAGFHLLDKQALCGQLINHYMELKQRQVL